METTRAAAPKSGSMDRAPCPPLPVRPHGLVAYDRGLALQTAALAELDGGEWPGIVLALRHPPTVTLGRRTAQAELHATPQALADQGIGLFQVDRGGGATYHYPEQAVVYPILALERLRLTIPILLERVRDALLETLTTFRVHGASWDPDRPGIYVDGAKIASVGFHLSRGRTTHGIALNVGRGWQGFRWIDPCKMRGLPITSIEDLTGAAPHPDRVCKHLACAIAIRARR